MQSRGYFFRYPKTDLGRIFRKKYVGTHFCERKFPNQGTQMGAEIAQRLHQRQPRQKLASGNERLSKPGVQGRSPGPLSPHFSGEMGTPAGQAGQRGAAPRGTVRAPTTCRVRTAPTQRRANHKRTAGNPAVLSLSMGLSEAALTPPPGGSPLRRCREPPWCRRGPGWRRRPGPEPGPPPR